MRYMALIVKAVFLIYVILFCMYNTTHVDIVVFPRFAEFSIPLFLPVIAGVLLGGIIAFFFYLADKFNMSREMKNLRKTVAANAAELEKLRNMPLLDDKKDMESRK